METRLRLDILQQPDDVTCGPTCLHAVYKYYDEAVSLDEVISEVRYLETGGTLAVLLGNHALSKGYQATIYTYNLNVFDPTWAGLNNEELSEKLRAQLHLKDDERLIAATTSYLKFLKTGGKIRQRELNSGLIRKFLKAGKPVLTGVNATYLYNCARETYRTTESVYDDVAGYPTGHFIVLCGYHRETRTVLVADPLHDNPAFQNPYYEVKVDKLINSILLGILTYDANLLVIEPKP
ncbi:MAG: C39 family peptidase [Balneolia bacterium]|nr:C39 family peptidase [Balneolia bacterium]